MPQQRICPTTSAICQNSGCSDTFCDLSQSNPQLMKVDELKISDNEALYKKILEYLGAPKYVINHPTLFGHPTEAMLKWHKAKMKEYNTLFQSEPRPISIIHPSRQRVTQALKTAIKWLSSAADTNNIEYIISIDMSDPVAQDYYAAFNDFSPLIKIVKYDNHSAVEAINNAAKTCTGNLMVVVSDDFDCPQNWDTSLLTALKGKSDYVVKTKDGTQEHIITLPILDRKYYERFEYIYYPDYQHMFVDTEMTAVGSMLDKIIRLDLMFPHLHPSTGKTPMDALNVKLDKTWAQGEELFHKRREMNFGLTEFVNPCPLRFIKPYIDIENTPPIIHAPNAVTQEPQDQQPLLSVLICTMLTKRKILFEQLIQKLFLQKNNLPNGALVEILFDAREDITVGEKRNALVIRATGKYVAFVDDDDDVADNYLALIVEALSSHPDCCSLRGKITTDGKDEKTFIHSVRYKKYFEENGIYYRPPNHLNAIKALIAKRFQFPHKNFSEDTDWAMEICKAEVLKTESYIDQPLYYYKYISNKEPQPTV